VDKIFLYFFYIFFTKQIKEIGKIVFYNFYDKKNHSFINNGHNRGKIFFGFYHQSLNAQLPNPKSLDKTTGTDGQIARFSVAESLLPKKSPVRLCPGNYAAEFYLNRKTIVIGKKLHYISFSYAKEDKKE